MLQNFHDLCSYFSDEGDVELEEAEIELANVLLESKQYSRAELKCQKLLSKLQASIIVSNTMKASGGGGGSSSKGGQGSIRELGVSGTMLEAPPPPLESIGSLKSVAMTAAFHCRLRAEAALNLQLAAIGEAQHLFDEVRQRVGEALEIYTELDGADSLGAAACYHLLASCHCLSNHNLEEEDQEEEDEEDEDQVDDAKASERMLERALNIRTSRLGDGHPETLQSKRLLATVRNVI